VEREKREYKGGGPEGAVRGPGRIPEADALIFDVDGVLIDVERSFPQVIRTAVQWGWRAFVQGIPDRTAYREGHQRVLKNHKAFNDDYDIAWTLLCLAAEEAARGGDRRLSRCFPSPEELRERLEALTEDDPVRWVRRTLGERVPREPLRSLCSALYFGDRRGEWGLPRKGLVRLERPNLSVHFTALPLPVGIYTGRSREELESALETLGWGDFPRELAITPESGAVKPSPKGFERIARVLGCRHPIYFGDARSDRMALEAYGRGTFVAVGPLLEEAPLRFPDLETAIRALFAPEPGEERSA
jgi:phosphoglycolate phosphatase-like HAD superfamily hydrolase